MKGDISESTYYELIADEVTEKYANKNLLLICLRYLIYINRERRTYETFFDCTHVKERSIVQLIGMLENNGISVSDCRIQAYNNAKDVSSGILGADAFIKKQQSLAKYTHCPSDDTSITKIILVKENQSKISWTI